LFVEGFKGWVLREESLESGLLAGKEVLGVGSQSGEVTSVIFDLRRDLSHEVDEVLLDHSNNMEAIRDDFGVGEVPLDEGAVRAAEIHADDTDVLFAFEGGEVGVESLWVAAFDDVEDSMSSEVTECRGELGATTVAGSFSMDGVLVDAENRRADAVRSLPGFDLSVFVIEAFDRGRADAFAPGENTACDAIAMALINGLPIGFGGVAMFFNAR
jgi:hypothetical protein